MGASTTPVARIAKAEMAPMREVASQCQQAAEAGQRRGAVLRAKSQEIFLPLLLGREDLHHQQHRKQQHPESCASKVAGGPASGSITHVAPGAQVPMAPTPTIAMRRLRDPDRAGAIQKVEVRRYHLSSRG